MMSLCSLCEGRSRPPVPMGADDELVANTPRGLPTGWGEERPGRPEGGPSGYPVNHLLWWMSGPTL